MAATLRKLKDEAQRQYLRGRFDRAVALYFEAIRISPADAQLRLRHAEACRRAGLTSRALDGYRSAARLFLHSGHRARALSTLTMALELAPRDAALRQAVAALREPATRPVEPVPIDVQRPNETREGHVTLETFAIRLDDLWPPPDVRRFSERALAVRNGDGWLVVPAQSPLSAETRESLAELCGEEKTTPDG